MLDVYKGGGHVSGHAIGKGRMVRLSEKGALDLASDGRFGQ
ncbi:hypothetical protein [Pseudomonas sp. TCU-HL1]|nr:hypothetical protein [Pseudomonas sp. TCU-HL1]